MLRGEGGGPGRHLRPAAPVVQVHSPRPQLPSQPPPCPESPPGVWCSPLPPRAGTVGAAVGGGTLASSLGSGHSRRGEWCGCLLGLVSLRGQEPGKGQRAGQEGGQSLGDLVLCSAWKTATRESLQVPLGAELVAGRETQWVLGGDDG